MIDNCTSSSAPSPVQIFHTNVTLVGGGIWGGHGVWGGIIIFIWGGIITLVWGGITILVLKRRKLASVTASPHKAFMDMNEFFGKLNFESLFFLKLFQKIWANNNIFSSLSQWDLSKSGSININLDVYEVKVGKPWTDLPGESICL